MQNFSLTHLSDSSLLRTLADDLARENGTCAQVLADLAEVDARRLYLPAGYPSMFEFCVRVLGFPREKAFKRIRAARTARRFPAIFGLVAEGRLSITAVVMLAADLTEHNARELLAASAGRTVDETQRMLVARFPRPDVPARITPLVAAPDMLNPPSPEPASAAADAPAASPISGNELSSRTVERVTPPTIGGDAGDGLSSRTVPAPEPRPRVTPLAPERFAIQCTISKRAHENLEKARELLRHQVPDGSLEAVLDRALALLVADLEKRRCAATERPQRARATERPSPDVNPRHIPASVKRAVWKRDGGRCTFVSASGRRCEARGHLELDHEHPVARGGTSTIGNLRLRCRAHNQYEAERAFGAEFMRHKREATKLGPGARPAVASP